MDEEIGATGTYNCFPICDDLGYYFDGAACAECHNECRYCESAQTNDNCFLCNKTAGFEWRIDEGFSEIDAVDGDHLAQCRCAGSTYHSGNDCMNCDPSCLVCNNWGPNQCEVCAPGYYLQYDYKCRDSCPQNYVEDDEFNICVFDFDAALQFYGVSEFECPPGSFYSKSTQSCSPCNTGCLMCAGGSKACTVCKTGYFLTEKGECSTCKDFFKRDMVSSHNNRW